MVNYVFATDEQRDLADNARKILEDTLKPRIEEYEHADGGLGVYPREAHQALVDAGYYAMYIPEEWGGLGMDPVTQGLIIEEMGKVDAGFAFSFAGSGCYFNSILATGMSKEEKQLWADRILAGAMGAFCLTEPGAGSDAVAIRTSAVKDGNDWIINGTKCFVSYAPNAEYFLVTAWTDKTKRPSQGVTCFLVEKERSGIQIGKKENKLGLHLSETSEVVFEDVRVPEDHVIAGVGQGFSTALGSIESASTIVNCCPNLGMAQAALDEAVEYAKVRRQFGKRIADHQGLGFILADMKMRTEVSRAMLYQTINCQKENMNIAQMAAMTKVFVTDSTMQTCLDAVQVLGGYGYMKDYPVERYLRNAKIFQIFGGTNQIKRKNLNKLMFGRDPETASPR